MRHHLTFTGRNNLIYLTMSILSLLFGCRGKKTAETAAEWPRFPDTDYPGAVVKAIPLDGDFALSTFFIAAEKDKVFALGSRRAQSADPDQNYAPQTVDYRLYSLDQQGAILQHLDILHAKRSGGALFGAFGPQMLLLVGDYLILLDTRRFAVVETIPVYDERHFPSKEEPELMTPGERTDAYQRKFEASLQHAKSCQMLDWTPDYGELLLVETTTGKHSAWIPMEGQQDLSSRCNRATPAINPDVKHAADGGHLQMSDGATQLRETDYLSAGTQLDYPNYKTRTTVQYELKIGARTLHCSTSDRNRHGLYLGFADNLYLCTGDGAMWLKYEDQLYRLEAQ